MAVRCGQCGEELLGAVNRCWRCGSTVLSRAGDANLPPIRRPPIPVASEVLGVSDEPDVVVAALADQLTGAPDARRPAVPDGTDPAGPSRPATAKRAPSAEPRPVRRIGSPFAEPAGQELPVRELRFGRFRVSYGSICNAAAVTAVVLGLVSLSACFFTSWAIIAAVLGLGLGLGGVYSRHRGTAIMGILLCCLALTIGSFFAIVGWYESQYGYPPWDAPTAMAAHVGWVKVAQHVGGPAQAGALVQHVALMHWGRTSDRWPTAVTACLTHPTQFVTA